MKLRSLLTALLVGTAILGLALFGQHVATATGSLVVAALAVLAVTSLPAQLHFALGHHAVLRNNLGTLAGTLVLRRAFRLTFQKFPQLRLFSMGLKELDGRVEQASLGQTVTSRLLQPSSITNFGTAAELFNATDVNGTLSNFRQIYHVFTPAQINATERQLIDEAAEPMAIGLAQGIASAMGSLVCRSNFGLTVNTQGPSLTVASSHTYANTLVPLMGALDQRGVPAQGRYFLAGNTVNQNLLVDPLIVSAFNNPANANAIANGELPQITSGLRYDKFISLPNTDGNLLGFAGTPDALCYIARAPKSPDEAFAGAAARAPFAYGVITDEMSGFSAMVQQWIDTDMRCHTRICWLDGLFTGNPTNLVRLVSGNATGTSGTVTAGIVTNPGYGYRNSAGAFTAPTVTVTGGGGSGATATATIDAVGAVTGITITAAGTGYTSTPTLVIAPVAGGRSDGPATAVARVGGLA